MAFLAAFGIIGKIIAPLLGQVFRIIDQAVVDKDQAAKLKAEIQLAAMGMNHTEVMGLLEAQSSIITAEAKSDSWLTKSWRPIVMLMFAGCVLSHWLGYTPENMSLAMVNDVMMVIKIGLGGYVGGRSIEKAATAVAKIKFESERKIK